MAECVEITCPGCNGVFVVVPHMLKIKDVDFHCPFCDLYFKQEQSPKVRV